MNTNLLTSLVVIIIIAGGAWYYFSEKNKTGQNEGPYACTMEAKICPDGSAVGRTGPKCEFAACPTAETPHSAEQTLVEAYIRANIGSIATEQPVLGGTWQVTSVVVNPVSNSGTVTYEDGHIQGSTRFIYVIQGDGVTITAIDG